VAAKRLDLANAIGQTSNTGFQGMILHGEKGYPLAGTKVQAITGGAVKATATSNQAGFFTLTGLKAGSSYNLKFTQSGFVTRQMNAGKPPSGKIKDLSPEFIVPSRASTASDQNWRIVVYWKGTDPGFYDFLFDNIYSPSYAGYSPEYPYHYFNAAGLEANAYLKNPDGDLFYWYDIGNLGQEPFIKYMHDSITGEPIECHVIQRQVSGKYQYWVRIDPSDFGWGSIKYAVGNPFYSQNPFVVVYKGNTQKAVIKSSSATRVESGTKYWYVFDLSGDTVTVKNTVQDTSP
jgi:hypothetical protein